MDAIMLAMVAWLNLHTEFDMQINLPNVVFMEPANLCNAYGISDPGTCKATQLLGFYNKSQTIYLTSDFNISNPQHQSYLLHELVHYLQWQNGEGKGCWGTLEVEAYNLQDEWRYQHHVNSQTDAFKLIMLEAACDDDF